jgi:hypothetical protein
VADLFDQAFFHAPDTEEEARALLANAGPDDAVSRARTLGYYLKQRHMSWADPVPELLRWIVRRHPNDLICAFPAFKAAGEGVPAELGDQLAKLWHAHEREGRLAVTGFENASRFFRARDWREAERLLLVPKDAPKRGYPRSLSLGKLRAALARSDTDLPRSEHAKAALMYLHELAEGGAATTAHSRQYARQICAEAALVAEDIGSARRYAALLLQERAPHGLLHHVAYTVLGRIALLEGDVPKAREALLAAAETPRDHVSSSYGPRLSLAKRLLAAGERDAVLTYLRKRAESWDCDDGTTARWIAAIEARQTPDWDDHRDHV